MIFLGYRSGLGDIHSGDETSTNIINITNLKEQNAIVDDSFITKSVSSFTAPLDKSWDFDTILHAAYQGNLLAGNIDFVVSQVSSMRIKRREKGTYTWTTLFQIPINSIDDLSFERFDRYCKANTEYEYALIPVINGVEGSLSINSVLSTFDGIVLSEIDKTFQTPLDAKCVRQKNRSSQIINTLDGKYPVVVINSQNCYDSGTASGVFLQFNDNVCEFDIENGWKYRDYFMDFLLDGKPKFLKMYDGRAWIVSIVDVPSEDGSGNHTKITTSFSWVEIGDVNSTQDLNDNGLIDIGASVESW